MLRVFVCSPLRDPDPVKMFDNIERAKEYCLEVARQGFAPFAPHVFCTQFLDELDPQGRELGISIGLSWLLRADSLWYWPRDDGSISDGMALEIRFAEELLIPVIRRGANHDPI